MSTHHDTSWWYWRGCAVLLTYGLFWNPMGFCYAGLLSIAHLAHYIWREKSLTAFTVQVRALYLAILIAAAPAPMHALYVAPFFGTWAVVLYGYCFLARALSVMPWNRTWPLTADRFWSVMTSPPQAGSAFDAVMGGAGCRAIGCEGDAPLEPAGAAAR
ncbi:MAG: hypothetical protein KF886_25280 [Candidatus Hydrogenedentes bacterium]|nr:hypothetical protein [Candidatus Hydrogenedentota bacterium]